MFMEEKRKIGFIVAICLLCFSCGVFGTETEPNTFGRTCAENSDVYMPCDQPNARRAVQQVWRQRPPSSYCLKFRSCSSLQKLWEDEKYVSRPFSADGYNWTLVLFPKGNTKDNGNGYVSIYVAIDNSSLIDAPHEVYADLKFFIFNKKHDKYFTVMDNEVRRFHLFKTMWGIPQFLQISSFHNQTQGYLSNDDECVFGVDISVASLFNKWELLSISETYYDRHTWRVRNYSTLDKEVHFADEFSVGGRKWTFQLYPNGYRAGEDNSISLYLYLATGQTLEPYEQLYVRAKLRILDQLQSKHVEKQVLKLFDKPGTSWGYHQFLSFAELRDPSKGFLVDDTLVVQVEFEALSSVEYHSAKNADLNTP